MSTYGIRLPKLLQKGCVLQRGEKTRVWGWCDPGQEVQIQLQGKSGSALADAQGRFEAYLENLLPGGPFTLKLQAGTEMLEVTPVYVGDVFVCAGQSNMELPMNRVQERYPEEFAKGGCPGIFVYKAVEDAEFTAPLEDHREGAWHTCMGEELQDVSAFSYFFGKFVKEKYKIPVGIINTSLGGTPAEAWTSREGLQDYPELLAKTAYYRDKGFREQYQKGQDEREKQWHEALAEQETKTAEAPWQKLQVPGIFAEQGLDHFSGLVWMKREFEIAEGAGEAGLLRLGTLTESDKTYINGVLVGETGYRYPPRRYQIPEGLLKKGKNEIAIRLVVREGNGRVTPEKAYELVTKTGVRIPLEGTWDCQIRAVSQPGQELIFFSRMPSVMFQGMTAPCLPYTVKGAVWYQGESNDVAPDSYEALLKNMIRDWRAHWKQEKLPFIIIQLPNCDVDIAPGEAWPKIRQAQSRAGELCDTAVTVNLDLGEDYDLHPLNKEGVARRVFLAVQNLIYKENVVWEGPVLEEIKQQGKDWILQFDTRDGNTLEPQGKTLEQVFEIMDEQGNIQSVPGLVCENRVVLKCQDTETVKAVRYAWKSAPGKELLYNRAGLPAGPFCRETERRER